MTITFQQLEQFDFDKALRKLRNLKPEDISALQEEVKKWNTEQMAPAVQVLKKYYHMTAPENLIKEVLCNDLEIAFEVYSDSVSDTSPRAILMDSLLHYIGVPHWPANCDGEDYVNTFYEKFKQCGVASGLTFQPQ